MQLLSYSYSDEAAYSFSFSQDPAVDVNQNNFVTLLVKSATRGRRPPKKYASARGDML
jgi:hypothetical protein